MPRSFSIHCRQRQPGELRAAQESFPLPVPGCASVYWCGFAAERSFGATAYFIRRPQVRHGGELQWAAREAPDARLERSCAATPGWRLRHLVATCGLGHLPVGGL